MTKRLSQPLQQSRSCWTIAEIAVLREHWPVGGWSTCQQHLPGRTRCGASSKASEIGAITRRATHSWKRDEVLTVRAMRAAGKETMEIAKRIGVSNCAVKELCRSRKIHRPEAKVKSVHAPLIASIRDRAKAMHISLVDLDHDLHASRKIWRNSTREEGVPVSAIFTAVDALGGRLTITWEPLTDAGE